MDETKSNVNIQRLLITVGIVLVTAAAVGGTVWYLMDKSANDIKTANDQSIAALQKQIDEQKTTKTTPTPTPVVSTTTTYTNDTTNVSFSYPKDYTLVDKSSTNIGSPGDSSFYYHSDFAKATLYLSKDGANIAVNILESTDMDKVLSSMGDTSNNKTIVKYGDYSGYVATKYGLGFESKIIVDTIVGKKYSIAISAPDPSYSTILDSIIRSVKFN